MNKIIVTIGTNTHVLIYRNARSEVKELEIPNCATGVDTLIHLKPDLVIFIGNSRWRAPFVACLRSCSESKNMDLRYITRKTQKGQKEANVSFAKNVYETNIVGAKLLPDFVPVAKNNDENEGLDEDQAIATKSALYSSAMEYYRATNEVRRAKGLLLSTMGVLFPEAVAQSSSEKAKGRPAPIPVPPGLWTRSMECVLDNPDPHLHENNADASGAVQVLAMESMARELSVQERDHYSELHASYMVNWDHWEGVKKDAMDRLRTMTRNHPMVVDWNGIDTICVLTGFLGWRQWMISRESVRATDSSSAYRERYFRSYAELQRFCGLDVSKVDDKGQPRISRRRKEIRNYLYLLMTTTKLGRELAGDYRSKVKREDKLLKKLWQKYLRYPLEQGNI